MKLFSLFRPERSQREIAMRGLAECRKALADGMRRRGR